jgi:hypothetical protein
MEVLILDNNVRHFFFSGNTTMGFYSYFNYIIDQKEAERIYCIKGGPGTGKSTFMKNIGQEMENQNNQVEYIHCSSDCDSIDAVVIKNKKVALIDGTAPHIVDPKNPAAVDEIINLGEFWDREKIKKQKDKIIIHNNTLGELYKRAYRYLGAAKFIYDDIINIYSHGVDLGAINVYISGIKNTELKNYPVSNKVGKTRKAFACAVSPQGVVNYIDTLVDNTYTKIIIKGELGAKTDILLKKVADEAIKRGLDVELFYCILDPENKVDHLIIPEIKLALITSNKWHTIDTDSKRIIDLNKNLNNEKLLSYKKDISYNSKLLDELLKKAVNVIGNAKIEHDKLEKYYIRNMNFEEINALKKKIVKEINSIQ